MASIYYKMKMKDEAEKVKKEEEKPAPKIETVKIGDKIKLSVKMLKDIYSRPNNRSEALRIVKINRLPGDTLELVMDDAEPKKRRDDDYDDDGPVVAPRTWRDAIQAGAGTWGDVGRVTINE